MPTIHAFAPAAPPVATALAPADLVLGRSVRGHVPPRGSAERPLGRLAVDLIVDEAGDPACRGMPARFHAELPLSAADFAGRVGTTGAGITVGDGATRLHLVLYVSNEEAARPDADMFAEAGDLVEAPVGRDIAWRPATVGRVEPQTAPQIEPETLPAPLPAPRERARTPLPVWRLKRTLAHLEANLAERVTLADLAAAAGLTRMHFAAQFRVATGLSPHAYLLRRRIERAQELMCETQDSLVSIALDVGFQTQAHFTTVFKRHVGETPHRWRCANAGAVR